MNDEDQFERRLEQQPLRRIPPAWRAEILAVARASTPLPTASCGIFSPALDAFKNALSAWLWPHPKAWAGLATAWLLALGLNFVAREPARHELASQMAPVPAQVRDLLKQQNQMLAELIGPQPTRLPDPRHSWVPKPRSERREEVMNA